LLLLWEELIYTDHAKGSIFVNDLLSCMFTDPTLRGASVVPTTQNREFTMLLLLDLPIVYVKKVRGWSGLQLHDVHTRFHENRSTDSKVERGHISMLFLKKESKQKMGIK
jgi:hypothetical protein